MLISSLVFIIFNYLAFKPLRLGHYVFTLLFFVIYGFIQDYSVLKLQLVDYHQASFPWWTTALYISFLGYYGDAFNYLTKKSIGFHFFIGLAGGAFSYFSAVKVSPIEVINSWYYLIIGISWGIFFPLSIKVFYEGLMWNKLLDLSIFWSFDLSGFLRHQKSFKEEITFDAERFALITGGTSGLGKATAIELADQGVKVIITGRNLERGNSLAKHPNIEFIQWDMTDWSQIKNVIEKTPKLDYLVLNAGGMPDSFETNPQGIELQFASQLFGHYYLAKDLRENEKLKHNARIVWVTSGGMYLKSLDLETIIQNSNYDKVSTYANVKRAQVTLLSFFKEQFPEQLVLAMHPGWAATPGVESAIPGFAKKMQGRLRSSLQGADTILWLLCTRSQIESGALYFDRKKVPIHLFWFTKKSEKLKDKLIQIINEKYSLSV